MLTLLLVLRVIHILGGVFWAGSSFLMTGFIEPTVRAAGDDGRRFMQRFNATSRFSTLIAAAAGSTVLAGLWLMWIVSGGSEAFFQTGRGLGLTIGMLAGIIAFILGFVMQNRPLRLIAAIGGVV
ncbi:MAG: putative rane protein, partial [Anaerolineales bacterium]|nr:putative rane protein [Anaerolineales bacterium]